MRVLDINTGDCDAGMSRRRLLVARYTFFLNTVAREASLLLRSLIVLAVAYLVLRQLAEQKIIFTHSDGPLRRGMMVALTRHIVARVCVGPVDVAAWSSRARYYGQFGMLIVL